MLFPFKKEIIETPMKTDRLFQILYLLLEKKKISAPELAEKLEVSPRTIYRDIDTLSACGIPVYTLPGKNGGISLLPGYKFDKSFLSDREQDEILFALQSFQATNQNMNPLLAKLGTSFQKSNHNWIEVDFSRWGYHKSDSETFNFIKQGILEKQILDIEYCNSNGVHTWRQIKPLRLIFKSRNWYLQAYCLKADDFRVFKLNRIRTLTLTEEHFTDTFDSLPSLDTPCSETPELLRLKLRIPPANAFRAYDEFSAEDIESQPDGSIIINAILPHSDWIYHYILGFGTGIEILEPLSIKQNLLEYLKKMQSHFKI